MYAEGAQALQQLGDTGHAAVQLQKRFCADIAMVNCVQKAQSYPQSLHMPAHMRPRQGELAGMNHDCDDDVLSGALIGNFGS